MDDNEMWQAVQTCDLAEASKAVFDQYLLTGKSLTSS